MFHIWRGQIPQSLLHFKHSEDDISILIGQNGSGKSSLLNEIAQSFLTDQSTNVIGIANTIHDKFKGNNPHFFTMKVSDGKKVVKRALINCLASITGNEKKYSAIRNTLNYAGFNPVIGFKLRGFKMYQADDLINESNLDSNEKDDIQYSLKNYHSEAGHSSDAKINFYFSTNISETKGTYLLNIFKYETVLRKLKIISGIDMFLFKENERIPVLSASSGELTLISSLLYITSFIERKTVILVDEPENSLHPKWQVEYIKQLNQLFYLYEPKIIIATHSPLIINGGDTMLKPIEVFKGARGIFEQKNNESENVEEIYQDYFNVTTPQNRYLSELVVEKMNDLADRKITLETFETVIQELKDNAYDNKQLEVLSGIIAMGQKIVNAR